jgi:hypothetical protein
VVATKLIGHSKEVEELPLQLKVLEITGKLLSLEEQDLLRKSESRIDTTAVVRESKEPKSL